MLFELQIERNVEAMARELQRDPTANQLEWTMQVQELLNTCAVTESVTLGNLGAENCHRFLSTKPS